MSTEITRTPAEPKQPIFGNSAYDIAKDATTIWLPALATLYAAVAAILNLPYSVEVVGVIAAIVVFLGTVLKISSTRYNSLPIVYNGELKVNMTDPMKENYSLQIDEPWDQLAKQDEIRIKVVDESGRIHVDGLD